MRKLTLSIILLIQFESMHGQSIPGGVFLSPTGNKSLLYAEIKGQQGIVFSLGRWLDKAGTAHSILFADTILKQPDTAEVLYAGRKTKIQRINGKLYLLIEDGHKKNKSLEIDTTHNTSLINNHINNAYWWDNFLRLCSDIRKKFELYHYSFRNGFTFWNSFDNQGIHYKDFKTFADRKLQALKDSISAVQTPYVLLTNEVIKNIATIDYPSLKDSISRLPAEYSSQSGYFSVIINSICNTRPELFFRLAEDMPDRKNRLFDVVDNKATIKKLKAISTDSAAKKEFLNRKKEDMAFLVKALAATAAGITLLGVSLFALF